MSFPEVDIETHDSPYIETQIVEYGGLVTRPAPELNPIAYGNNDYIFEDWYAKDEETGKYYLYDFDQPLLLPDDQYFFSLYAMFAPNVVYQLVGEGTDDAHYVITESGNFNTAYNISSGLTKMLTFDMHNELPITEVGPYAFAKGYRGESLTFDDTWRMRGGVKTGPSLKKIGHHAFRNAGIDNYAWSWIDLSDSLELVLEEYAFSCAGSAYQLKLPKTLKDIPNNCFEYSTVDGDIEMPLALESIGMYAFSGNPYLSVITLRKNIQTIGEGAFYSCPLDKIYYEGSPADKANIAIDSHNNEALEDATWYYFTENGENETKPGHWWYYDEWGYTKIEKVVS